MKDELILPYWLPLPRARHYFTGGKMGSFVVRTERISYFYSHLNVGIDSTKWLTPGPKETPSPPSPILAVSHSLTEIGSCSTMGTETYVYECPRLLHKPQTQFKVQHCRSSLVWILWLIHQIHCVALNSPPWRRTTTLFKLTLSTRKLAR